MGGMYCRKIGIKISPLKIKRALGDMLIFSKSNCTAYHSLKIRQGAGSIFLLIFDKKISTLTAVSLTDFQFRDVRQLLDLRKIMLCVRGGADVIRHKKCRLSGRALKTAFLYSRGKSA
jgi:hypothetical protein